MKQTISDNVTMMMMMMTMARCRAESTTKYSSSEYEELKNNTNCIKLQHKSIWAKISVRDGTLTLTLTLTSSVEATLRLVVGSVVEVVVPKEHL